MTHRCPTCSGVRLYGWTFEHLAGCPTWQAEDTTQAADMDRMATSPNRMITRSATPAEILLVRAMGKQIGDQATTTVRPSPRGRHRTIGGHEPETP